MAQVQEKTEPHTGVRARRGQGTFQGEIEKDVEEFRGKGIEISGTMRKCRK